MKTKLFLILLVTGFVFTGNLFAASHGPTSNDDNLQPATPSEIFNISPEITDRESLETIQQRLNDPDPFVRVEAVQALGEIYKQQSLVAVCDCLDDENLYVRAYAAEALGKIGQIDVSLALSKLLPALDDPSPYVRAMMVSTLGELQDERAAASIRKLLHDEDESVRGMAAWALKNIENSP